MCKSKALKKNKGRIDKFTEISDKGKVNVTSWRKWGAQGPWIWTEICII